MSDMDIEQSVVIWSIDELRELAFDPASSTVCARNLGMMQRVYPFSESSNPLLKLRYTLGFPLQINLANYLWLTAHDEHGEQIDIAVDPSYVFDRTGCYVPHKVFKWGGSELVPIHPIVEASLGELSTMLHLRVQSKGSITEGEIAEDATCNDAITTVDVDQIKSYLALDFKHENKVVLLGKRQAIDRLEETIRLYSSAYWDDHKSMGERVRIKSHFHINPIKRHWTVEELGGVDVGDLIAVENFHRGPGQVQLRGQFYTLNQSRQSTFCMEVFLQMNSDDTQLYFGSDEQAASQTAPEVSMSKHNDDIELEIYAGSTTISFNDLCAVQAGTLVELRDHSLPFVKLCVMGSPILEGELVNFQDQVMIQITKRLD